MKPYPKIHSLFKRDPATNFKTFTNEVAQPEFAELQHLLWRGTEKVDGTNLRVYWSGYNPTKVYFGGRTDNAEIPSPMLKHLAGRFPASLFADAFDSDSLVCLYGEGYGAGIQKGGGNYSATPRFILFDVWVSGLWLSRENVEDVAQKMHTPVVPILGEMPLDWWINFVQQGFESHVAEVNPITAEGVVLQPRMELKNRLGERIITKLKHKDFTNAKQG